MNKLIRRFLYLSLTLATIAIGLSVNFVMPSYDQTIITGMEVKRMDKDGLITKQNPPDGPVRDVYFIFTKHPQSGDVMVYRNEDTRFSFPWYFKFDSATIQANAQERINSKDMAEIKYYGWRITYWDEFPNVLTISAIGNNYRSRPWISYCLYLILIGLWVVGFRKIRKEFKD